MKPSSKLGRLCGLIFCCVAAPTAAGHAATRVVAHPMFDVRGPAPHAIGGAIPSQGQRQPQGLSRVQSQGQPHAPALEKLRQHAEQHGPRHRFFSGGFTGTYLSGDYVTAPDDVAAAEEPDYDAADAEGPPGVPPPYVWRYRPPPCVVPLVIEVHPELRPKPKLKLPVVTYGAGNACPPPVVAAAPLRRVERHHLN